MCYRVAHRTDTVVTVFIRWPDRCVRPAVALVHRSFGWSGVT